MIGDASDLKQVTVVCANDAADIFVESFDEFVVDRFSAVSRAEDDVIGELGECAHDCCRRFAARFLLLPPTPGWHLGLHALTASRPPYTAASISNGGVPYVAISERPQ